MYKQLTISLLSLLLVFSAAYAMSDQKPPNKPRPDGNSCIPIPGGIRGFVEEKGVAGTTYYTEPRQAEVFAPLNLAAPFYLSAYDSDALDANGNTKATNVLLTSSATAKQYWLEFKGQNNRWAQTYTVTENIDMIHVYFATTQQNLHPSTHLCLFQQEALPTALTGTLEPRQNYGYLPAIAQ